MISVKNLIKNRKKYKEDAVKSIIIKEMKKDRIN